MLRAHTILAFTGAWLIAMSTCSLRHCEAGFVRFEEAVLALPELDDAGCTMTPADRDPSGPPVQPSLLDVPSAVLLGGSTTTTTTAGSGPQTNGGFPGVLSAADVLLRDASAMERIVRIERRNVPRPCLSSIFRPPRV